MSEYKRLTERHENGYNSSYETSISSLGKTLFLTEEAVEAQIKELQEKQK